MRHSGTGQGQGNEQCFNSVFHTVFSLFVNSGITLTAVKTVNKWQCSEMEKAAKATFSCYSCKAFFCEAASGLLLFQRIANFDFRLFTQVTHQSFKDDLCVVLGDTLHHRFFLIFRH